MLIFSFFYCDAVLCANKDAIVFYGVEMSDIWLFCNGGFINCASVNVTVFIDSG